MDDNRIADRVRDAASDLNESVSGAFDTASGIAGDAKAKATEAGRTVQNAAIEAGRKIADRATETYRQTYGQGVRASEYVSQKTAEQPFAALFLAAAIGYAIAYMVHRH